MATRQPVTGIARPPLYRTLRICLEVARLIGVAPLLLLFEIDRNQAVILADVRRWLEIEHHRELSPRLGLLWLLARFAEFRTLFYYRAAHSGVGSLVLLHLLKPFYRGAPALYLFSGRIGPGLYIQHGFSSIISAESIGERCWINQQVTIGAERSRRPIIGDNVRIAAGAKVIGGIRIGNNVTVGANAVVVRDVPPDCVVAGVPARIVRRAGVRVPWTEQTSDSAGGRS